MQGLSEDYGQLGGKRLKTALTSKSEEVLVVRVRSYLIRQAKSVQEHFNRAAGRGWPRAAGFNEVRQELKICQGNHANATPDVVLFC
jgi:hypothetical protein